MPISARHSSSMCQPRSQGFSIGGLESLRERALEARVVYILAVSAPIFGAEVYRLKANIFEAAHVLTDFKCQVFLRYRIRFDIKILPCPFSGTRSVFFYKTLVAARSKRARFRGPCITKRVSKELLWFCNINRY